MNRFIPILLSFVCLDAFASYRVYQLQLTYYDAEGNPGNQREELSTLDPFQYENYYGGYGNVRAEMLDTWYCPGDTGRRRALCPKPTDSETPLRGFQSTLPKRSSEKFGN